jgi:hypothetical protein
MRFVSLFVTVLLLSTGGLAKAQTTKTGPPPSSVRHLEGVPAFQLAVVTDREGKSSEVSDLTAVYAAAGYIMGPEPKRAKSILVVLSFHEGRVWTHEELSYSFDSIRSIEFDDHPTRIERRDGSKVLLFWDTKMNKLVLTDTDAAGNVKRTVCDEVHFFAGVAETHPFTLVAFAGRGRSASGREGAFYILESDVRRIEFHQPQP